MYTIIRQYSSATQDVSVVTPSNLLYAMWNFVDYMAGYAQQDAHEFLIAFLSSIDAQLSNKCDEIESFSKVINCFQQLSLYKLDFLILYNIGVFWFGSVKFNLYYMWRC